MHEGSRPVRYCVIFYRKEVVQVFATVVEHVRLAKVIIFKKKRRKGYKKKKGNIP